MCSIHPIIKCSLSTFEVKMTFQAGMCSIHPIIKCSLSSFVFVMRNISFALSLRAGSLVWVGDKEPRTGEKNEVRKSEPARELLIFEFRPSRGVKSAFHMCQKTIQ